MPNLSQRLDAFTHVFDLELAVKDVLDRNGPCRTGIDDTLVILDRNKYALLVKHRPMIADNLINFLLEVETQVGQIHIATHNRFVLLRNER